MSQFTKNVSIQPIPKTSKRKTTEDIVWYLTYPNGKEIIIPKGYVFDGASTPTNLFAFICILAIFFSPRFAPLAIIGYYMQRTEPNTISAAVLHDYIYTDRPYGLSLSDADDIFLQALIACDTNKWKALAMRAGVRLGGRRYWYKIHRKCRNFLRKLRFKQ